MKPITKVFLVIGALALCLVLWLWVFGDGNILMTAYEGVATVINDIYQAATGTSEDLVPPTLESDEGSLDDKNHF